MLGTVALALVAAACGAAQGFPEAVRAYARKPTSANRAVVEREAKTPLAFLALAATDLRADRFDYAARLRTQMDAPLDSPMLDLADYVAYTKARAFANLDRPAEAAAEAEKVLAFEPASPLGPRALLLAAEQYVKSGAARRAVRLLQANQEWLPAAEGALLYANALKADGDFGGAALQYQKVFYEFARSSEADAAGSQLKTLQVLLGPAYPPVTTQAVMQRAEALIAAGKGTAALTELTAALDSFGREERDLARVRIGQAREAASRRGEALAYLENLKVESPEADAERLFRIIVIARRLDQDAPALRAAAELREKHPRSAWRLQGALQLGNSYLVRNQPASYEPFYTECFEAAPDHREAANCHWKVVWSQYLRDRPAGPRLFRDHLERYPKSDKADTAAYFLGRLAELRGARAEARAYFDLVVKLAPNSYYGVLSRGRLDELRGVQPAPAVAAWLGARQYRAEVPPGDFIWDAPSRKRIERARLLGAVGLDAWSNQELRFGASYDAKPAVMAIELARLAEQSGDVHIGVRSIRDVAPGYLRWGVDQAPEEFWRYAFPLPFRDKLETRALENAVDPYLMAALIRQESEFDPRVVSRANAIGLTQIKPSTGKEISRQLGIKAFKTAMLYDADTNLQMGVHYLGRMLNSLEGKPELALAAYNAGRSRAVNWRQWGDFREPAEFIETIPFNETRAYVQIVLRNADLYRRLYPPAQRAVISSGGLTEASR